MRSILLAVAACALGCGDQPLAHGTPMSTQLVGDWFLCDAPDCSILRNHGARWDDQGRWVLLEALGVQALDPTGTYCESPYDANRGPYDFDMTTGELTMTDDLERDAGSGMVTFAGATASLTEPGNGVVSLYERIDPPRSTGTCALH